MGHKRCDIRSAANKISGSTSVELCHVHEFGGLQLSFAFFDGNQRGADHAELFGNILLRQTTSLASLLEAFAKQFGWNGF